MAKVAEGPWAKLGVFVAIVGVVLAAYLGFSSSKSATGTTSSTSSGKTSTGSTLTPAPATTSLSVYYHGSVLISGFPGVDFDINPPGPGPDAVSISYNTFSLAGGSSTVGLAVWANGGTPAATDCKTLVSTQLVPNVYQPVAGMKICFKTDQGRIGLLQVMPGTSENQFKATATVWGT